MIRNFLFLSQGAFNEFDRKKNTCWKLPERIPNICLLYLHDNGNTKRKKSRKLHVPKVIARKTEWLIYIKVCARGKPFRTISLTWSPFADCPRGSSSKSLSRWLITRWIIEQCLTERVDSRRFIHKVSYFRTFRITWRVQEKPLDSNMFLKYAGRLDATARRYKWICVSIM